MCDFPGCNSLGIIWSDCVYDDDKHLYCVEHFRCYHNSLVYAVDADLSAEKSLFYTNKLSEDLYDNTINMDITLAKCHDYMTNTHYKETNLLLFQPGILPTWCDIPNEDVEESLFKLVTKPPTVKKINNTMQICYSKSKEILYAKNIVDLQGYSCIIKAKSPYEFKLSTFKLDEIDLIIDYIKDKLILKNKNLIKEILK